MKEFESLTIRQAATKVFPFLTATTIHTWLSRGIFMPCVYEPPPAGPGRGCKLDLSDLVTIGILHSLFSLGVRFDTFQLSSGVDVQSNRVVFQREDPEAPKKNNIGGKMPGNTWIIETPAKNIGPGREIQSFLEEFDYKVWISVIRKRVLKNFSEDNVIYVGDGEPTKNVFSVISFFPSTKDFTGEHLDEVGGVSPIETISFINARHWLDRVKKSWR